ncbi:MAG TPA: hypothetical protein VFB38_09695 [Chthonomonadaceae bacterium]|nr:hypothetical protein [Chthonomonadaceae bacterium]
MAQVTPETQGMAAWHHRGPSLGGLGIVFVALFIASQLVMGVMTGGTRFPTPYAPITAAQAYYLQHADAVRIAAFLQFGAAIPLGIFTATVTSRLNFWGMNVAGVSIALFGGFAASIFLAASALAGWALSQPGIAEQVGAMRTVQLLGFATGGVGHVVPLGLLLAGVTVPSAFARLLPRWLVYLGLILAAIAELSTLSLVLPQASFLLPLGRFPAFIWMIGVGFTMPTSRDVSARRGSIGT